MKRNPNIFDPPKYEYDYVKFFADAQTLTEMEKRNAYADMCRKDIYFLLRYGASFPAHVMDMPFAVERCKAANSLVKTNNIDKWMHMAFRGGYKSVLFNYGINLQTMLTYPEDAECIFSFNKKLSMKHLKVLMSILELSEQLKDWFPNILYKDPINESRLWSALDGFLLKRESNRAEPTCMSSGLVSGKPTGMHFNYETFDDIVTGDTVKTFHSMEETLGEFESALSLIVTLPSARIWRQILGTYYYYGDPHCAIRDKGTFKYEKIPWRDENGDYYVHSDEMAEFLIKTLSRYEISTQYELEPVPDEDRTFDIEKIQFYDKREVNVKGLRLALFCDPATKKKESRNHSTDRTAMWVLGKDGFGNEFFIDGVYDRITRPQAIEKAFNLVAKYNIPVVRWEQAAAQEDEHWIRRLRYDKKIFFKLDAFNPEGDKRDRIEGSLLAVIENGILKFPPSCLYTQADGHVVDLIKVLKMEMTQFPHGKDDFMDCGAQRSGLQNIGRKAVSSNSALNSESYGTNRPGSGVCTYE